MNIPVLQKTVTTSYAETLERVTNALSAEGFGVLTEIDVQATMKKKLDVDFRPYKILGACNPPLAKQALEAEVDVGVLLPCNVVVRDVGDGTTRVTAIEPMGAIGAFGGAELAAVAAEVKERLGRALERIG